MHIVICDDDKNIGILLTKYIQDYFADRNLSQPTISCYDSGDAMLADQAKPDILFLDVQMEGINGIDTGHKMKEKYPDVIIFMETSYLDYLDDAMRFHVFRYLTKPIDRDRLFRNMDDAMEMYRMTQKTNGRIEMKMDGGITSIAMSDIVYIEARNQRTYVYTRDHEYESWNTLQEWINQLDPAAFFQPHRSYIVNFKHVNRFDKNHVYLCDDKFTAYLAARKYKEFHDAYFQYVNRVW